jgi:hypothetical protein
VLILAPIVAVLAIAGSQRSVRQTIRGLLPNDWSFLTGDASASDDQAPSELADTGALTKPDAGRRSGGEVGRIRPRSRTGNGVIRVTLTGGSSAFVVIDGQTRGGTPLSWTAAAGKHVVSLRGEDRYTPAQLNVDVSGGDTSVAAFIVTGRR